MQLQRATYPWSCLVDSFAMALDQPAARLIEVIGHNGARQCYKDQSFRQGFHIQECIDLCLQMGFACTEIQGYFGSSPFFGSTENVPVYTLEICELRFEQWLRKTERGVLTGIVQRSVGTQVGHAVAWDGSLIYDPRGFCYPFKDAHLENFQPQTLWMLTKMESEYVQKILEG